MVKTKVLIADDHALVREGARQALHGLPDAEVIGLAEDGESALRLAQQHHPDVLLLDISMPGLNGIDVIPLLKRSCPQTRIVVLSIHQKEVFVQQALAAGALGYVLKTAPISDVIDAVRAVAKGNYFLSAKIEAAVVSGYVKKPDAMPAQHGYDTLTEREQQVFRLVVQGRSNKQIGELLALSPRTVEKHRAAILHKLDVRDTVDMVRYAVKLGILDPDDA
ncbi:MAG: response regulator transcription factor [Pseudomonadota bacterium]